MCTLGAKRNEPFWWRQPGVPVTTLSRWLPAAGTSFFVVHLAMCVIDSPQIQGRGRAAGSCAGRHSQGLSGKVLTANYRYPHTHVRSHLRGTTGNVSLYSVGTRHDCHIDKQFSPHASCFVLFFVFVFFCIALESYQTNQYLVQAKPRWLNRNWLLAIIYKALIRSQSIPKYLTSKAIICNHKCWSGDQGILCFVLCWCTSSSPKCGCILKTNKQIYTRYDCWLHQ